MSWDEKLFHHAARAIEGLLSRKPVRFAQHEVRLEECSEQMGLIAAMLCGRQIEISEAEAEGGTTGRRIYLPGAMALFESAELNRRLYLWRTLLACAAIREKAYLRKGRLDPLSDDKRTAAMHAFPRLKHVLDAELPRLQTVWSELSSEFLREYPAPEGTEAELSLAKVILQCPVNASSQRASKSSSARAWLDRCALLWGALMPQDPESARSDDLNLKEKMDQSALSSGTELKSMPRERITEVQLNHPDLDENPLVHVFEKIQTAEEYKPGNKARDGSDDLSEHQAALEELDLRHVIRGGERAESIFRSDVMVDCGVPDLAASEPANATPFIYDEWNRSSRAYRKAWCRVYSGLAATQAAAEPESENRLRQVRYLRAYLERLLNEKAWDRAQIDGPEIDLNATVDWKASARAGSAPKERLYLNRKRRSADVATLILLDSSLSTDSWIDNQRVLDIELETIRVLSEVLDGIHDAVEIAAFNSRTRQDCRYIQIKRFEEAWARARERIGSVQPEGYTRIGPALRHATALLRKRGERKKLILLISDGKPTDYDRYEGSYGIADIHQAIQEANSASVKVRALAVDAQAKAYLPAMLGRGNYQILSSPARLPQSLAKIYAEILS